MTKINLFYPKHKHPHGVQNLSPNEYRIWVCEECGYIFTDDEIRKDEEVNEDLWGHKCERKHCRCESHLEPYMPELSED